MLQELFNRIGNIEIQNDMVTILFPCKTCGIMTDDDVANLKREMKKAVYRNEKPLPGYLFPEQINLVRENIVFNYNTKNYKSFDFLRQLPFLDQLSYFQSFISIARRDEIKVLWNRLNFVLDESDKILKALFVETEAIPVRDEIDAFSGAKYLIMLSLTNRNTLTGKPRKIDFISPSPAVIRFAETLLQIDNIDDLENYIASELIRVRQEESAPVVKEKNKGKALFSMPKITFTRKEKRKNPVDPFFDFEEKPKKRKKNSNNMMVICVVVLALAFGVNYLLSHTSTDDKQKKNVKTEQKAPRPVSQAVVDNAPKTMSEANEKLLSEGYEAALLNNYPTAISYIEKIGFKNLTSNARTILFSLYKENNELYKIIDIEPDQANKIVNDLVANGNINTLYDIEKNMKTQNPYVEMEVAFQKQQWKNVLKYQNQVKMNGHKEQEVTLALLNLHKVKEAKAYAQKLADPDLIKMVQDYEDSGTIDSLTQN